MVGRGTKATGGPERTVGQDEAELWRHLVGEQLASGLSQVEFCEGRRVSPGRFRYWKYTKLALLAAEGAGRDEALAPAASLVPVRVVQGRRLEPWGPLPEEARPSGVEVVLPGGLRVSLQRGFDGSVLREVVEVLGC